MNHDKTNWEEPVMKKKILRSLITPLLLVALLAVGLTVSVSADTVKSGTWGDLTWELNMTTGELTITGEGEMMDLEQIGRAHV